MPRKKIGIDTFELQKEIHSKAAELYPHHKWDIKDVNGYWGFVEGAKWLLTKTEG